MTNADAGRCRRARNKKLVGAGNILGTFPRLILCRGDRTCLHYKHATFFYCPLNILRKVIMIFYIFNQKCYFAYFVIGKFLLASIFFIQLNFTVSPTRANKFKILICLFVFDDNECFFIYFIMIGSYFSLHYIFSQAKDGFDNEFIFIICYRVDTEGYPRLFRLHHALNHCSKSYVKMIKFLLFSVIDSACGKKRCPTFSHLYEEGVIALNV